MLSIAIFTKTTANLSLWKSKAEDLLVETETLAKISYFDEEEKLITAPESYDIYIIDMDTPIDTLALSEKMFEIDKGSHFIFISENKENAFKVIKKHLGEFVTRPADPNELKFILKKVKQKVKEENIIIQLSSGERRVRVNNLNYINIEKRCLCYHLADGNIFDGQSLRASFIKAIRPLNEHPNFLFAPPSLLINIMNVKDLYKNRIVFDNEDVVYISKNAYELISKKWHEYN